MTDLDPVIHAPVRLRIMTVLDEMLDGGDEVAFTKLRDHLGLTSGNLTTHLAKLEEAAYIATERVFEGRKPVTYIAITPTGRGAYASYRDALLDLLGEAGASRSARGSTLPRRARA